jgi:hypothetical protein
MPEALRLLVVAGGKPQRCATSCGGKSSTRDKSVPEMSTKRAHDIARHSVQSLANNPDRRFFRGVVILHCPDCQSLAVGVRERAVRYWELKQNKLPTSVPDLLEQIEAALRRHGVVVFLEPTPGARLADFQQTRGAISI